MQIVNACLSVYTCNINGSNWMLKSVHNMYPESLRNPLGIFWVSANLLGITHEIWIIGGARLALGVGA